mmetsp:Transcript_28322/g.76291  ORF Transcript_28322/g.76291 Transcript_28322/m.76291 type:complete len:273 (-) Transcript_28322:363-1181(-)
MGIAETDARAAVRRGDARTATVSTSGVAARATTPRHAPPSSRDAEQDSCGRPSSRATESARCRRLVSTSLADSMVGKGSNCSPRFGRPKPPQRCASTSHSTLITRPHTRHTSLRLRKRSMAMSFARPHARPVATATSYATRSPAAASCFWMERTRRREIAGSPVPVHTSSCAPGMRSRSGRSACTSRTTKRAATGNAILREGCSSPFRLSNSTMDDTSCSLYVSRPEKPVRHPRERMGRGVHSSWARRMNSSASTRIGDDRHPGPGRTSAFT